MCLRDYFFFGKRGARATYVVGGVGGLGGWVGLLAHGEKECVRIANDAVVRFSMVMSSL